MRDALAAEMDRLRPLRRDVAWVAPENLHVTLKFLGRVEADRLERVGDALAGVAASAAPFALVIRGLGGFPSASCARVVWAGLGDGSAPLAALAARVDDALEVLEFAREQRPFSAHVTLGRIREPRHDPAFATALDEGRARDLGGLDVRAIALMRSDLSPRGARYTPLGTWPLAAQHPGGSPESPWRT